LFGAEPVLFGAEPVSLERRGRPCIVPYASRTCEFPVELRYQPLKSAPALAKPYTK
jgi:hypothetical protein